MYKNYINIIQILKWIKKMREMNIIMIRKKMNRNTKEELNNERK